MPVDCRRSTPTPDTEVIAREFAEQQRIHCTALRAHYQHSTLLDIDSASFTRIRGLHQATVSSSTASLTPTTGHARPTFDRTSFTMAWLPWSSNPSEEGGVKKTAGGAFESPSRTNRKKCYEARDTFFECLDKNNILDSINTKSGREKAETFCSQFDKEFEKNCAHSWVSAAVPVDDEGGPRLTRT